MLQVNNGDGTFSEVGQVAGISNTDWSWASLFADFDNDGWKDLFITNGYYRDYTDRDFLKRKGDYYFQKTVNHEKADTFYLVNTMTSTPVHNYIFRNSGKLTFSDESKNWGFDKPGFSNGAAYSDLDNDGDLDLVVNNLNDKATVFKNLTQENAPKTQYLSISLKGLGKNTRAIGSKVYVYAAGNQQFQEMAPMRGFQSSVSYTIHFGLGENTGGIDSVKVVWPVGQTSIFKDIAPDQVLVLEEKPGIPAIAKTLKTQKCLFSQVPSPIPFRHQEYGFNDFKRQPLLTNMLTPNGPTMAVADVNNDGREDVFVGASKGSIGKIFIQNLEGQFAASDQAFDQIDVLKTDADAIFFDADGDGDQDLYIASGGYEDYQPHDLLLQDRLYLNDGSGHFSKAEKALPPMHESKSCVRAADFDGDGDIDLFVGSKVTPGEYPMPPESYLLENDGNGHFTDGISTVAPGLKQIGMITDAAWADMNNDQRPDLLVIGEYMPLHIFLNQKGGAFIDATNKYVKNPENGLWSKMAVADFDHDGDADIILGNFGLNSQLKANPQEPLRLVYKDFDHNGSIDPILTYFVEGQEYPFVSRDQLVGQMYDLRKKFPTYASYANAKLSDVFSTDELKDASELRATTLKTIYLENDHGQLVPHQLPIEAQFAPVSAIETLDFNHDGKLDFILAGNQSATRVRIGLIDANYGQLFKGDGAGNFEYIPQTQSGLHVKGDVKSMNMVNAGDAEYLLFGINNVGVDAYRLNLIPIASKRQ